MEKLQKIYRVEFKGNTYPVYLKLSRDGIYFIEFEMAGDKEEEYWHDGMVPTEKDILEVIKNRYEMIQKQRNDMMMYIRGCYNERFFQNVDSFYS